MQVRLYVKEGSNRIPVPDTGSLPVVPRKGEKVTIMSPGIFATVVDIEYNLGGPQDLHVSVILDRMPGPAAA